MKIIDGVKNIDICYENGEFSKNGWDTYIQNVCVGAKKLIESDSAGYDFIQDILPVLNSAYSKRDELELLHRSFSKVTYGLEEKIKSVLNTEIDVDIVLYLGLCNGAGWATKINGNPTVLLGIEKIIELNWCDEINMIGLIYHELGHLWHTQERTAQTKVNTSEEKSLWQVYSEGVAMYFEQLLCEDDNFYHQNKNGWLKWCRENRQRLFKEYISRLERRESVKEFFGDWHSFEGYSDVGYFLGIELIRNTLNTYSLKAVLNLGLEEIMAQLLLCANKV